jgi:hypothetical protein
MACRGCSSDGCSCSVTGDAVAIEVSGTGTPVTDPYVVSFDGAGWLESLTEESADCDTLLTPLVPVLLGDGSVVSYPLPCVTAVEGHFGGDAFAFTFLGDITDTDPGNGAVKFNSATYSLVSEVYVDLQDILATDITAWLDSLGTGRLRLYQKSNPAVWADFTITSVVSGTGYRKIQVSYNDHAGAFGNDIGDTVFSFIPGSTTVGPAGTDGGVTFPFTFSTTTTDSDPGSGLLRFNNATYSSVTSLFVDLLEFGGTDITTWLDSLDNSTNTIKGSIKVSSASDQTKWVMFVLTGVTTVTGYRKLVVSYIDHNGALTTTAGDTTLSFAIAGDAGVIAPQTIKAETTNYGLVLADAEKWIDVSGTITITVPLNATQAFAVGTHIDFWNSGSGTISFVATGGVTIQSESAFLDMATQYTGATLVKTSTDTWALLGKLS